MILQQKDSPQRTGEVGEEPKTVSHFWLCVSPPLHKNIQDAGRNRGKAFESFRNPTQVPLFSKNLEA